MIEFKASPPNGLNNDFVCRYERLAAYTRNDLMRQMANVDAGTYEVADGRDVSYVDLKPPSGDYARTVVSELPYGNGWGLNHYIRHRAIQCALPDARFVIFPNNNLNSRSYVLHKEEKRQAAAGDFTPLAEMQAQVIENLGVERLHVLGYSQGASIGARLVRFLLDKETVQIGNSGLAEAPNVFKRSSQELRMAFTACGRRGFNAAVNASQIDALSEEQRTRQRDIISQAAGLAIFGVGSWVSENRALRTGMAQDTFWHDLNACLDHPSSPHVTIGFAEKSRIMPMEQFEPWPSGSNVSFVKFYNHGHEAGDNLPLLADFANKSIAD